MSELLNNSLLPDDYPILLTDLKERIRAAQVRAGLAVNQELVLLYWQIGREILSRQGNEGWGARTIDRLSSDLRSAFPEMKGFSPRNLKYMRAFAQAWPDEAIVQAVLAQLTWYHNIAILEKVASLKQREWYIHKAIEHGWSRNVLVMQIESRLFERQGKAPTNFERTLPAPQSDLAQQILKDPYSFDFLTLGEGAHERDLERGTAGTSASVFAGDGSRVCVCRQSVPPASRGQRLLSGLAVLSHAAALLCRD